jgi:hypothetical protein
MCEIWELERTEINLVDRKGDNGQLGWMQSTIES